MPMQQRVAVLRTHQALFSPVLPAQKSPPSARSFVRFRGLNHGIARKEALRFASVASATGDSHNSAHAEEASRGPLHSFFAAISEHKAAILCTLVLVGSLAVVYGSIYHIIHHTYTTPQVTFPTLVAKASTTTFPLAASLSAYIHNASITLSSVSDIIFDRVSLLLLRMSAQPVWLKLANIFVVGLPLVFLLGVALSRVSDMDVRTATLKIYALLYRAPGANAINETSNIGLLIVNLAYFGGLFVFAVLIGFVGDEIKSQMKSAKSGNYALHHRDHLLVLNWNRNTVPLLRQIASARNDPGSPYWGRHVVVMANKEKHQMDADIASGLRDFDSEVHTRQGVPFRVSDLKRVNAAAASTVILLHPEDQGSETTEAGKAATLMSLCNMPGAKPQSTSLLVQGAPDTPSELNVVESLINSPGTNNQLVLHMKDREVVNRLLAQTAMQPGLASVYSEIIQQGKGRARALFQPVPELLAGKTYGTVRRSFNQAVVMGVVSWGNGELQLNTPDDVVVEEGDKLLLLARDYSIQPPLEGTESFFQTAASRVKHRFRSGGDIEAIAKPRKIIIAGWAEAELPLLLSSLEQFAVPGSQVMVVTREAVPDDLLQRTENCCFSQMVVKYPTAVNTLLEAGIKDANTVVVGGLEAYTDAEAESRVLAALVQVQDASRAANRSCAPHVVAKVRQPNTAKVARQYLSTMWASGAATAPTPTAELLLPEEFMSAIISQVAGNSDYQLLMNALLDSADGQEIYLHPPEVYHIKPGASVSFAEIQEAARLHTQTALGFLKRDGSCILVPGAGSHHTLREGDNVIVLAEDYAVKLHRAPPS